MRESGFDHLKDYEGFRIMETDAKTDSIKLKTRPPTLVEKFQAFKLFLTALSGYKPETVDEYYSMKHGRKIQVVKHPQEGGDFVA
jgi:hypothetical protein